MRNESKIIKREAEEACRNAGVSGAPPPPREKIVEKVVTTNEPPPEMLRELDDLKTANANLQHLVDAERASFAHEKAELTNLYEQAKQEVAESEQIVQECLDEKKRRSGDDGNLSKAVEQLRKQLGTQQETVGRYEAKVKKRESELKAKTQELRSQRADTANAKLQVSKLQAELETLRKSGEAVAEAEEAREAARKELEEVKRQLCRAVEEKENYVSYST